MNIIDIQKLNAIKNELDMIDDGEPVLITDNREEKYIIISTSEYDSLIENKMRMPVFDNFEPGLNVIAPEDMELSDEEFEELKKLVLEALESKIKKNSTKS